jgi:1,4-dihydroxy-2-naphthoate polyprenyltransferase
MMTVDKTIKKKKGSSIEKEERRRRPALWKVWWTATRPHTVTASLCPCLVACAACPPPTTPWDWQMAWTVFCISVQIGTNLHNDYSDFVQGADHVDTRVGQARATALGWLSPQQTCRAATLTLFVTFVAGVYLALATNQGSNPIVWLVILSSIFNAFAYTAGPYPLGYIGLAHWSIAYSGLGDIFVLLYFGLVAVLMIPYLLACQGDATIDWLQQVSYGFAVGMLATNILIVNNLRDRHTDARVNKRTTAVRFGRTFSLTEYALCTLFSYSIVVMDASRAGNSIWRLLPFLSLPLAIKQGRAVFIKEGAALNEHVGGTAGVQLVFCVLLAIGLRMSS